MHINRFHYNLPQERIAARPVRPRSSARLLLACEDRIFDQRVNDLPGLLLPGDRLVFNDTRVIHARLNGQRRRVVNGYCHDTRVEATLLGAIDEHSWQALLKPMRRIREGDRIAFGQGLSARVTDIQGKGAQLHFNVGGRDLDAAIAHTGTMPLPPYIARQRQADCHDLTDYQSTFARHPGAVAAPTASLHFDAQLLARLAVRKVRITTITLHVGAGTFLPVSARDIRLHQIHRERAILPPQAAAQIHSTRSAGGRIIAVGTTALRTLESAAQGGVLQPWAGTTDLFVTPGFQFRVVDGLLTNFHLPCSTLMMLVCALMGTARIQRIYAHAIARNYRFLSYGDASLLLPRG